MENTSSPIESPSHEINDDSQSTVPGLSEYVSLRNENSRDGWLAASNSKTASTADISLMQREYIHLDSC